MKNLKNVFTLIGLFIIGIASFGNYQLQEATQTETILEAGQFITPELAQNQDLINEVLFGEERIFDILNQKGAEGLRVYQSKKGVVLIGTDADGYDVDGLYLGFGLEKVGGMSMLLESEQIPVASL